MVVLLHGFPEFWYAWRAQLADLGADRLVLAPDQRGYGLSDKPEPIEAYRVDTLVSDVLALADGLGKERFAVVGHDWGGIVAWSLAVNHPDRVDRLVAINAPHPALFARLLETDPAQREASAYMTLFVTPEAGEFLSADGFAALDGPILRAGMQEGWLTDADRAAYLEAWARPGALEGMLAWYRAANLHPPTGDDFAPALDPERDWTVRVPTLVLWGERDPYLLPANLAGLESVVPDLRVERVSDAGHWIVHERPGMVNRAIRTFLDA